MSTIIRKENGEVRFVSETVALEEKNIDGVKCYVPIGDTEIGGTLMRYQFPNAEIIKAGSKFYAFDKGADDKNRLLYSFGLNRLFEDGYDYFVIVTVSGQKLALMYSGNEVKEIYFLKEEYRLKHPKHWPLSVYLDKPYVYAMKDGKDKEWYDFKDKEWKTVKGIREDEHIEIREYIRKLYVYICEGEMECAVYDPETGRIFRGSPMVELAAYDGGVYAVGKDMSYKLKTMYNMENGDTIETNWDQLTVRHGYVYDLSKNRTPMRKYSFEDKKWVKCDSL